MSSGAGDGIAGGIPSGRVLVVDDSGVNRYMLSQHVTQLGHEVAAAENGLQALERLRSEPFDLVLLDVMMPEMDGYTVLEKMQLDPEMRDIPVIVISGLDEIESVVRCIERGAADYLHKPFNPTLLKARINACLEKRRLRSREVVYLREIEEEKRRADELLRVILPDEIIEELKATNTVKPRLYENVAVLFTDVVGFTPYCEDRQPEEVISNLQRLVKAYEELALRGGLQKIKTIGDSFMATAGLLRPSENPVLDCVRCGLEMIAIAREPPTRWCVRVGIHVGSVVAGVVGSRQYLFDLWGDCVNTASRVERNGVDGAVNVSGEAWQHIAGRCHGETLGHVAIKGKGTMELYKVLGLRYP